MPAAICVGWLVLGSDVSAQCTLATAGRCSPSSAGRPAQSRLFHSVQVGGKNLALENRVSGSRVIMGRGGGRGVEKEGGNSSAGLDGPTAHSPAGGGIHMDYQAFVRFLGKEAGGCPLIHAVGVPAGPQQK